MDTTRRALILFSLLLAAFAISLDTTIVNVALPTLVRELHASTSQLQWVVDAFNLAFAALLLTSGSLSDRLGRRGMLISGLGLFGIASLAGGFTATAGQLIVARTVMGVGAAMIFPATLSIIANVFTERAQRAKAIGLWGATAGIAVALGPIIGGWLLEHFGWESIFFVMAPVAAAGAGLVALTVPTSRDPEAKRIDVPGFALSTAAMASLVYTIIEAPTYGWGSSRSVVGFSVATVVFAGFLLWERQARAPMLDISLFKVPRFTAASGAVTVAFFSLFGFIFLMTQYFQFVRGFGPLSTGVHLLPVATSVAVGSVLGTRLSVRLGTKLIVTAGLLAVTGFYIWVSDLSTTIGYGTIALQMVLYGLGMGFTSAPATESIMGAVSKFKAGVGSAVNDTTRLLGGTLGVAVIGSVYASVYDARLTISLPPRLPATLAHIAHQSVGAALEVAGRLGAAGQADAGISVRNAASLAFIHGMNVGCLVAAGVAAVGAAMAVIFLPAQPPSAHVGPEQARAPYTVVEAPDELVALDA